jgi:aminopeptidase N
VKQLPALEDPFMRRMVWGTLHTMVRHERLRASEFMELILANLPAETDQGVLEYLLGGRMISESLFQLVAPERREEFAERLLGVLIDGRGKAAGGTDTWLLWHDAMVSLSSTPDTIGILRPLLDGDTLDQPRRWNIVGKLAVLGVKDMEALVEVELQRDPTDQGKRSAFAIRGAIPTTEAKVDQWERLADPDLSLSLQRAGSGSFHSALYPELSEPYVDKWFETIRAIDWHAEQHRIGVWFDNLFPPVYTPEFLERSKRELDTAKLPPRAHRAWQESNDQIERIIAIRAYDQRSPDSP